MTEKHTREEYHLEGPNERMRWHLVFSDNEIDEHDSLDMGVFSSGSLWHKRALKLAAAPAMFEALEGASEGAYNDDPRWWTKVAEALAAARGEK